MEKGKGWHLEHTRHSEARLYGKASGGKVSEPKDPYSVSKGNKVYMKTPSGKYVYAGSSWKVGAYKNFMKKEAERKQKEELKEKLKSKGLGMGTEPLTKQEEELIEKDLQERLRVEQIKKAEKLSDKKSLSEKELEELSPLAQKGAKVFASLSSKEMKEYAKTYKDRTGQEPYNIYNKEDFYEFVKNRKTLIDINNKTKQEEMQKEGEIKVDKKVSPSDYAGFTGTMNYYKDNMGINVTDGVRDFQTRAEANWLVSDIAVIVKAEPKVRKQDFVVVNVKATDDKAVATYEDGNGNVLFTQKYKYTDMPKGDWKFYFRDNVLMFPSEY
jgi:hypothetical protein